MKKQLKKLLSYLTIACIAAISALSYHIFIFPNQFAPSGLNGICTMIQHLTGVSVGYMSLLINIPLGIMMYLVVSRTTALRSMAYSLTFSLSLLIFEKIDLSAFAYNTASGQILGPLVAGVIMGTAYSLLVKVGSTTGGIDFIAALIHKKKPETNMFYVILALNVSIAVVSYFVYDFKIEPVVLCILYSFTSSTVTDKLTKSGKSAIRFEIVTDHPDALYAAIKDNLHHGVTAIPGKGMFRDREVSVLICVINKSQITAMNEIIRSFPDTFAVMSQVGSVMGNFKQLDKDGHEEKKLLDPGSKHFKIQN